MPHLLRIAAQRLASTRIPHWFRSVTQRLLLAGMLVGSGLITASSLVYFDFEALPPFVIEKLPLRFEALSLSALRIHVGSAIVAFPVCVSLLTRSLQRRPVWHRWLGRLTGVLVLGALVPSGVILAFDAKGGATVTAGFLLSAALVAGGMVHGVRAARGRDFIGHRRAMRHVVAQLSVAVSSRALLVALDAAGLDPDVAYVVALWIPVVVSAAMVELLSRRAPSMAQSLPPVTRINREAFAVPVLLRARAVSRSLARLGR